MAENENIKKIINENTQIAIGNLTAIKLICKKFENAEETIDMAIQALEENQQYRELGTVEHIKLTFELCKGLDAMVKMYQAIGTIDEFKALKEKNTPMELAENNFQDEVHHYLCPSCRNIVSCNQNYCEECGQALET